MIPPAMAFHPASSVTTSCQRLLLILHVLVLISITPCHALNSLNFSLGLGESSAGTGVGGGDCTRAAKCTPLPANMSDCLGTRLGFAHTSLVLANDSATFTDVAENLIKWSGLRMVPKCWEVVQPFLCSVYMPKCEDGRVEVPSYDMCSVVQSPCRIVEVEQGWPDFLQCDRDSMPDQCSVPNTYKEVTFNLTGECEPPLVATDNTKSWYKTVEGCGIQCTNPLFTHEDHRKVHTFIAVCAGLCVISTLFTLCTFFADWKNSSKYPAVILFYMNGCFFLGSIGFLAQFSDGAREDIVCRNDGTMRLAEPSEGENLSCVIVFIIVYYFIIAGVFWFVMLSYSWHLSFRALGTPKDVLQGKTAYFHLISWTVPFILVVVILALNQVDGDSLSGICFVGYQNHYYRAGFVLAPIGLSLTCAGFYLVQGLITLCSLDKDNPGLLSDKASNKIKGTIARIGVFACLAFGFVFITFACHLYDFANQAQWEEGFKDYLVCEANVTLESQLVDDVSTLPTCSLKTRPSIAVVLFDLFSMFGAGIAMSMWVWTPSTLAIWKRMWRKVTRQPVNEPIKLKKSKMIAKAFAKKRDKGVDDEEERLSLSFESVSHDDAIGMKLDLPPSSVMSEDHNSSSSWGNQVPVKLLARRGAAIPVPTISKSAKSAPDSSDSGRGATRPRGRNTVQTEAVIEPPPRDKGRERGRRLPSKAQRWVPQKKMSDRQRERLQRVKGPGHLETPLDADGNLPEDVDDCMQLPEQVRHQPRLVEPQGRGGRHARNGRGVTFEEGDGDGGEYGDGGRGGVGGEGERDRGGGGERVRGGFAAGDAGWHGEQFGHQLSGWSHGRNGNGHRVALEDYGEEIGLGGIGYDEGRGRGGGYGGLIVNGGEMIEGEMLRGDFGIGDIEWDGEQYGEQGMEPEFPSNHNDPSPKERMSPVQRSARFEIPGDSGIEHVL